MVKESQKDRCVFFFDFDDTVYSHITKSVPESTQEAMRALAEQGHILVMASGRGREAIPLFDRELEYVPKMQILLNGQIIYNDGEVVYKNHINLTDVHRLYEIARKYGFAYGGYCWDGMTVNCLNDRVRQVWSDFGQPIPEVCSNLEEEHSIYQAHLYITKEEKELLGEEINHYIPNWSHQYLVNLIHRSAGKARAVKWCMEQLGIPKEHTYAFGDGFNDVDMIDTVGHGIAMGNGVEQLKEHAEYVTAAAHENGIYQALKHYGFME